MRARAIVAALALVVLGVGCGRPEPRTVAVEITHGTATVRFVAEVAATPAQRQRGLMGRASLPADAGMLFLFGEKVSAGFWMKNTLIPLDIAFIDRDRIVEIRSMTPCRKEPCPITRPGYVYDTALEVNDGSFARAGVVAGDRVVFSGSLPKIS